MPNSGEVYEVKLFGRWDSVEETVNVYHFAVYNTGSQSFIADELVTAFRAAHIPKITPFTASKQVYYAVSAMSYETLVDFAQQEFTPAPGAIGTDAASKFLAYGFRASRSAVGQRYGYKRLAGVAESLVSNGVPTSGGLTMLNTYAAQLGASLILASGAVLRPVVVQRPLVYGVNPLFRDAENWNFQRITTQNSRKQ